jgi:Domain of Unknown Function (DUF928)
MVEKRLKRLLLSAWVMTLFSTAPVFSQVTINSNPLESELDTLKTTFSQRRPKGEGIRRGGVCAVSPGTDALQNSFVVWSDRPLFLWKADLTSASTGRLQVLSSNTEEILWERTLTASDQQSIYSGKPLQPGQTYSWELSFNQVGKQVISSVHRFQIMDPTQRQEIATELKMLTTQLQAAKQPPEAIAIRQAQFFANKGLLSDALQVLYGLQSPSSATLAMRQSLVQSVCPML